MPGCRDDASDGGTQDVWKEVTTPYDPACTRCVEVGAGALGHLENASVLIDFEVDDAPAQWNQCVASILYCIEDGGDKDGCVDDSECPDPCKADYVAATESLDAEDIAGRWAGLRQVFMDPAGRCALPQPQDVSP